MKPIQLVISSFGSYAGEEIVDFASVDHGIFLITGDTGAGKTTLFDAIMFALYDQTSGGKREGNMMRSQYASIDAKTYVKFTFRYRDKCYTVLRNPEYQREKKRKSADGIQSFTAERAKVELTLHDGSVFMGNKAETNRKIVEILGLDAQQFTQIAMIAQGEFLKLLHAQSQERKVIFSRIFNTKAYWRIQENLRYHAKGCSIELDDNKKDFQREIEQIACRKDSIHKEDIKHLKEHLGEPDTKKTKELLELLLAEGEEKERQIQSEYDSNQKRLDMSKTTLETAQTVNLLFDALENAKRELEQLESQKNEIQKKQEQLIYGKKAEQVQIIEGQYLDKASVCKSIGEQIGSLNEWIEVESKKATQEEEEAERKRTYKTEEEPKIHKIISTMINAMPSYVTLQEKQKEWEEKSQNTLHLQKKKELIEMNQQAQELGQLHQSAEQFLKLFKECGQAYDAFQSAMEVYRNSREFYECVYEQFFAAQAGILAKELEEGKPCPVCGSTHHPHKTELPSDAPSQMQLDEARKQRDEAEKVQMKAETIFREVIVKKNALFENIRKDAKKVLGEEPEDSVEGMEIIFRAQVKGQEKLQKQKAEYIAVTDDARGYEKSEEDLQVCEQELQQAILDKRSVESELQILRESLPCSDEARAKEELASAQNKLKILQEDERQAVDAYQERTKNISIKEGHRELLLKQEGNAKEQYAQLQKVFLEGVKAAGFESEAVYRNRLLPLGRMEQLEKEIRRYQDDVLKTEKAMQLHSEQTEGKTRIPIEELTQTVKELSNIRQRMDEERRSVYSINQRNREVEIKIKKIVARRSTLKAEYEVISTLSRTANGTLNQSIKLDFETYIQRRFFKQIIRCANHRFARMTSGQLALRCRELKDLGTQGQTGLDLDVYSPVTNTTRDVKTLSGGESFLAALSMALGLADVIQNTAGAIQLDTMFIDEGFGSLDDEARGQAIMILNELAGEQRLVGIISHVTELKEQIDRKLVVEKNEKGSSIHWVEGM